MAEALDKEIKKLIKRARNGDAEAFGQIYELFAERIFRYVLLKVSSKEEAEDLTQQVFVRAWESLEEFKFRRNPFTSWLYAIAHNLVVDFYRKQKKTISLNEEIKMEIVDPIDLNERLFLKEEAKAMLKLIKQLPEEQRDILILRFVEDLSYNEIAKITKKSPLTLRVLQHRALKRLRSLVDWQENEKKQTKNPL